jgi:hypothetical protein
MCALRHRDGMAQVGFSEVLVFVGPRVIRYETGAIVQALLSTLGVQCTHLAESSEFPSIMPAIAMCIMFSAVVVKISTSLASLLKLPSHAKVLFTIHRFGK